MTKRLMTKRLMTKRLMTNKQYYKFCFYGFLKNLRFFDAFFILFLVEKGLSYTEIGSLYAIRELIIHFAEIPTGIIADTYGRKNALVTSFLAYIISFILFAFGDVYWHFVLAFILYGIGDAFRSGTHKAMIMHYLQINDWQNQKVNYYGATRACSQRGSAISALIAGIIVFFSGNYHTIFTISIVPYIINMFLVLSYPKTLNNISVKKQKSIKKALIDLWKSLKNPFVFSIIHSAAVFTAFQKSVKDYIQPLMLSIAISIPILADTDEQKKTGLLIGVMYFVIYLLNAYASKKAGYISNKFKQPANITLIIGLVIGMISGLTFQANIKILSLLFFIAIYLTESIRKPILTGLITERVPNEILASTISAQSLYRSLLTAGLSLGFGYAIDRFGLGYSLALISGLLLMSYFVSKGIGRMTGDR